MVLKLWAGLPPTFTVGVDTLNICMWEASLKSRILKQVVPSSFHQPRPECIEHLPLSSSGSSLVPTGCIGVMVPSPSPHFSLVGEEATLLCYSFIVSCTPFSEKYYVSSSKASVWLGPQITDPDMSREVFCNCA